MSLFWWEHCAPLIYPVPIKPETEIRRWAHWPDDVRPILEGWNKSGGEHTLSFYGSHVFKCPDCAEFCRQHNSAHLDRVPICDDCLIARARATQAAPTQPSDRPLIPYEEE